MTAVEGFRRNSPAAAPRAGAAPDRARLALPVVLYFLAVLFPAIFNVGPLAMTGTRLVLLVMTVPLTLRLLSGAYDGIRAVDVFFFLHFFWSVLALAVNNPDKVIENSGAAGIEFLGGYLLGRAYIRDARSFEALCRLLVMVVLVSAPFAIFETLTGRPLVLEAIRSLPGLTTVALNYQDQRLGLERVQFTFAHPIHYGLFNAIVLPLAFIALKGRVSELRRYFTSAVVFLCGFLALSSGALLALALQVGLIGWAWLFRNLRGRWWWLTGLLIAVYVIIDLLSNRSALMVFLSYATFSSWTAYWRTIIFEWGVANVIGSAEKGIVGSPFFGIGLNDWVRPYYMYSGSMDNFWLVMAVRYGLPGFGFLAAGYLLGLGRIMARNFSTDIRLSRIRLAWVLSFVGLTFTLSTVHIWTLIYSIVFFMFGAGMWMIKTPAAADPTPAPEEGDATTTALPRSIYTRFAPKTGTSRSTPPQ